MSPELQIIGDGLNNSFRHEHIANELQLVLALPDLPEDRSDNGCTGPGVSIRELQNLPEILEGTITWLLQFEIDLEGFKRCDMIYLMELLMGTIIPHSV